MGITGMLLRTHFSLHHAQAASFHARHAAGIELNGSEEAAIALGAYVAAAVIAAGAYLEATGNEIIGSDKRPRQPIQGQPGTLLRLNEHIGAVGAIPISHTHTCWQSAKTLLDLRHRLVHYNHDWLDWGTEDVIGNRALTQSDLLPRMQTEFQFLPKSARYIPWFLSSDCAAWAVNTAVAFLDEFFQRLEKQPFHDHLRHRIEVPRGQRIGPNGLP